MTFLQNVPLEVRLRLEGLAAVGMLAGKLPYIRMRQLDVVSVTVSFQELATDLAGVAFAVAHIVLTPEDFAADGAPNPRFRMHALPMDVEVVFGLEAHAALVVLELRKRFGANLVLKLLLLRPLQHNRLHRQVSVRRVYAVLVKLELLFASERFLAI